MFTGIIQTTAPISWRSRQADLHQIAIALPEAMLDGIALGASVSVQGICLTVTAIEAHTVHFDVGNETLLCTNLGELPEGANVNIERSLKMGDELGGDLFLGHIMGIATITAIQDHPSCQRRITLQCERHFIPYLFQKGTVALNGVSLTVNTIQESGEFSVHLIPETVKRTTFQSATVGDKVNLEIDKQTLTIVETVKRVLNGVSFPSPSP